MGPELSKTKPPSLSDRGENDDYGTAYVHGSFQRGNGEPNLGGRPGLGFGPSQLRDSAGLYTGFAFKPSHPGDMAPELDTIQL